MMDFSLARTWTKNGLAVIFILVDLHAIMLIIHNWCSLIFRHSKRKWIICICSNLVSHLVWGVKPIWSFFVDHLQGANFLIHTANDSALCIILDLLVGWGKGGPVCCLLFNGGQSQIVGSGRVFLCTDHRGQFSPSPLQDILGEDFRKFEVVINNMQT